MADGFSCKRSQSQPDRHKKIDIILQKKIKIIVIISKGDTQEKSQQSFTNMQIQKGGKYMNKPKRTCQIQKLRNAHHARVQTSFPLTCNHKQEASHLCYNSKLSMGPNSHDP